MVSERFDFLNEEAKQYLDDLADKLRKNKVVLFAGGGLSRNAYRRDGKPGKKFPLWADITEMMLKKIYGENYRWVKEDKYDYLNVTDKYVAEFGRISLYQLLDEALDDSEFEPGQIHQLISRFNWEIITTNFDTLIERGYELTNKTPNLIITDPDLSNTEKPRIFKINGCIKHARDLIIITGDDFRTFTERKPLIELYVKKCFIESTILFVGFSMNDPAFRMIYGWVRDHLLKSSENRFAYSIQRHVDEPTKKIWIPKGIRFIELFPDGIGGDERLTIKHLYSLFYELYQRQIDKKDKEQRQDSVLPKFWEDLEKLENCLKEPRKTAKDSKKEIENKLFYFLKEIIDQLEKTDGRLLSLEKVLEAIDKVLKEFLLDDKTGTDNPNIWVMAIYTALRMGIFQELMPLDFFKKGFKIIRQAALKGESELGVSKDLHRYWMFSLMFIGPFKCAETLLNISRKIQPQEYQWDIQEHIHYHLEVFFGDYRKNRDLFLRALNKLKSSNEAEAFHKYLLLDSFFDKLAFGDLFLEHTYQELAGKFRSDLYRYRNTLSSIDFPVKKSYFKSVMQTVFDEVYNGKSLMFTGLSGIILSFPKIIIEDRDIKELKKTSLGELFLLAVIYDTPRKGKHKDKELKELMTMMVENKVIDAVHFLQLLLYRLEEADLEKMEQTPDNGLSRYLYGLVTFILCALPYLKDQYLVEIEKTIETHLSKVKLGEIRETMIEIIAYIYLQLPEEDFSMILKKIFSLAAEAHQSSIGLAFLKLNKKEFKDNKIIKHSQLRLLMDRSLEEQWTEFDRDFVAFMLNHEREDLFPGVDKRVTAALRTYFDIIIEDQENLSLQWLMDLQRFTEKGYIQLDEEMEKRVSAFIEKASEKPKYLREWKLKIFHEKLVEVFKTFSHLFNDQVIGKILDAYREDMSGTGNKAINLKDLDMEVQDIFAHLLKEIYESKSHESLKDRIVKIVKEFINEELAGGGHLGAFWERLHDKEKPLLTGIMLNLWMAGSETNILRAVKATGEFLKYITDEEAVKELTNRLLYCIFSGSPLVKIEWCKVVIAHIKENSPWYTENKKKILDCLNLFKKETNLELLREFLDLARLFEMGKVQESIDYLKENAPYAEIRRTAKGFAPVSSK